MSHPVGRRIRDPVHGVGFAWLHEEQLARPADVVPSAAAYVRGHLRRIGFHRHVAEFVVLVEHAEQAR